MKVLHGHPLGKIAIYGALRTNQRSRSIVGGQYRLLPSGHNSIFLNVDKVGGVQLDNTIYHEIGHMVSLDSSQHDCKDETGYYTPCGDMTVEEGKFRKTSYIQQFYNQFYQGKKDAPKGANEFVSEYAAENIYEDFAETFLHFIMGQSHEGVAEEKIQFMKAHHEFLDLQQEILKVKFPEM